MATAHSMALPHRPRSERSRAHCAQKYGRSLASANPQLLPHTSRVFVSYAFFLDSKAGGRLTQASLIICGSVVVSMILIAPSSQSMAPGCARRRPHTRQNSNAACGGDRVERQPSEGKPGNEPTGPLPPPRGSTEREKVRTPPYILIRQRHATPSCGADTSTAERTLDPARMFDGELDPKPGIRGCPRS